MPTIPRNRKRSSITNQQAIRALFENGLSKDDCQQLQDLINGNFAADPLITEPIGEPVLGQIIPCAGSGELTIISNPNWPNGTEPYIDRDGDACTGCVDCRPDGI